MTCKILITDDLSPQALVLLQQAGVQADVVKGLTIDSLADRIGPYVGLIVRSSVRVTETVLHKAGNLKVIGRAGAGLDNIDVDAARKRGIVVLNTPGANTVSVAEHTIGLLLALSRHIPQANNSLRTSRWERNGFTGTQLHGKTIGLIGLGRVGKTVALLGQAFGMQVIGYDPYLQENLSAVTLVTLDELYSRADIISLHTSLTPETRSMINAETIARMKPGVYLVNTARGAVIDEVALMDGLKRGQIAGAALDVFAEEPPVGSPLLDMPNVIVTPHLGASTRESQVAVGVQIVEQVLAALNGHRDRAKSVHPFLPVL